MRNFELESAEERATNRLVPEGWQARVMVQEEDYDLKSLLVLNNPYLLLSKDWPSDTGVEFPEIKDEDIPRLSARAQGRTICKIRDSGAVTLRFQFRFEVHDASLTEHHLLFLSEIGRDWREGRDRAVLKVCGGSLSLWEKFVEVSAHLDRKLGFAVLEQLLGTRIAGRTRKFVEPELAGDKRDPLRPYPVIWGTFASSDDYARVRSFRFETGKMPPDSSQPVMEVLLQTLVGALRPGRDLTFCREYGLLDEKDSLMNYCPVEGFFRNFTHRTSLCLSPPDLEAERLWKQLYLMTVEVMEAIRLRWHLVGIGNLVLDWEIQAAEQQLNEVARFKDPIADEARILEILRALSQERAQWATIRLRFMEDPVSHLMGSGSLNEMYERAIRMFRLHELDALLNAKSEALDRVIDQIMDFAKISQLLQLAIKEGREGRKKS